MSTSVKKDFKDLFVSAGAGIFVGAVFFDVFPEVLKTIGVSQSVVGVVLGVVLWWVARALTDFISRQSFAIVSSLGFLLHSFLEGAVVALAFGIDARVGFLVAIGMILHLFPEFFAITAILRAEGVSLTRSMVVDLAGIGVLFLSAILILFLLPTVPKATVSELGALSAGAFLYIGSVSFLKRARTTENVFGFIFGIVLVFLWSFVTL